MKACFTLQSKIVGEEGGGCGPRGQAGALCRVQVLVFDHAPCCVTMLYHVSSSCPRLLPVYFVLCAWSTHAPQSLLSLPSGLLSASGVSLVRGRILRGRLHDQAVLRCQSRAEGLASALTESTHHTHPFDTLPLLPNHPTGELFKHPTQAMVDSDVNAYRLAVEKIARARNDLVDPTITDETIARYKELAPEWIATIRREASSDSSEDDLLTFWGEMFEIGRPPPDAGRAVMQYLQYVFLSLAGRGDCLDWGRAVARNEWRDGEGGRGWRSRGRGKLKEI